MTDTEVADPPQPDARHTRRVLPRGVPFFSVIAVAIVAFLAGGFGASFQGKLFEVQKNDNSAFLPASAESTRAANEAAPFSPSQAIPGFLVFQRDSGLTEADKQAIATVAADVKTVPGVQAAGVVGPTFSADGTAAALFVPLISKVNGTAVRGDQLVETENAVIAAAQSGVPPGLNVYPAGPAGILVAFIGAFAGLDGTLLLVAGGIVVLILLLVYRSPVLWFFPLLSAGLALGLSALIVYFLAKADILTLNGQSQGILSVLVLGREPTMRCS